MGKKRKTNRLVIIEWEDSAQPIPGWQLVSDFVASGVIKCASVGWLVHDGDDHKVVAPNMGGLTGNAPPQISGMIHIPTSCILSMTDLKEMERG